MKKMCINSPLIIEASSMQEDLKTYNQLGIGGGHNTKSLIILAGMCDNQAIIAIILLSLFCKRLKIKIIEKGIMKSCTVKRKTKSISNEKIMARSST